MEDLAHTPSSDQEPLLPLATTSPEQPPAQTSSRSCLNDTSLTLGILSSIFTAVLVPVVAGTVYSQADCASLTALPIILVWLLLSLPTAVISCICAVVYGVRAPNKRGPARWTLIVGVGALVWLLLGGVVVAIGSATHSYCVI